MSPPLPSPLFFLVDENPNDSLSLRRELASVIPALRLRQATAETEFAQSLTMIETPTVGVIDWSVTFGKAATLLQRGRERWPSMSWLVFCRVDLVDVRSTLARAGLPGESPTVVTEFAELVELLRKLATEPTAPRLTGFQRLKDFWDDVPFGVALVNPRQRLIHYVNPVLGRWLGIEHAGLVGMPLDHMHPAEQVHRLVAWLEAKPKADAAAPLLEVSFNRGGEIRFADALVAPPLADQPDFRTIYYVDASERRALERKWRRLAETISQTDSGEEFFRTLVRGLCGVLDVDIAAVALLLPGEPPRARLVAMSDRDVLVESFEITMSGNPCAEVLRHRFLCVTQRVARSFPAAKWLISRGVESYLGLPLFGQSGQPIGILEVMHREPLRKTRDLRAVMQVFAARAAAELERLRADTARRQTEAGLAHTQRLAHIGSWELSVASGQFAWSDETYRLHGVDREDFLPTLEKCLSLVHRDDQAAVRQHLDEALAGRGFPRFTHRIIRADGAVRHLECEGEAVFAPAGQPLVLRGTLHDITERVETETELRRLALVVQETDHAVVITDADRRVRWVNAGFTQLTGFEAEELTGQPLENFLPDPVSRAVGAPRLAEALWQEERHSIRFEIHDKLGRGHWAVFDIQPLRDATGRIAGHFALGTDITDRKLTEEAQRLLCSELHELHGPDFFDRVASEIARLLDADMCVLTRFIGPDRQQLRTLALWADGKARDPVEFGLAGTPAEALLTEASVVHPAGVAEHFPADRLLQDQRMESYVGVPLRHSPAKVMGMLAILSRRPLTRRSKPVVAVLQMLASRLTFEIARQDGEKMFRDLFAQAPDATILVDRQGRIVMANQVASRMFGYSADEILGLSVESLIPESARTGHVAMRTSFHLDGKPRPMGARRPHLCGLRKDRTTIPVDIGLSSITTPEGLGVIATIRDMTEQRVTETQIRQSQRLESLGQLAGGIAHDFNNILSGILGFAELTLMDLPAAHPLRDNLANIQKAGLRARALVGQILAVSRRAPPALSAVYPAQAVREVLDLLRATLPATLDLTLDIDYACPPILADPTQFHQVLMNLCTNAWQSLPDGCGRITVEVAAIEVSPAFAAAHGDLRSGPHVRLTVADTGSGMDAATLERVFDPFFTTKTTGRGTGLGLAVVHGIVTAHRGAVTVQSTPGAGTTFAVYFPTAATVISPVAPVETALDLSGQGQRILLVDDDETTGPVLEQLLRRLGYCPMWHRKPEHALAVLAHDPQSFDLVLTDMTMPKMTGVILAEQIRRLRPDLPVLLITGLASAQTRETAQHAGVREVLLKPVTVDQLGTALRRYFT